MSGFIRSMLYTPADDPEMMRKAAETEADACIFDLEDAVPKSRQEEARENLRTAVPDIDFGGKQVYVRIEQTSTEYWLSDLRAAVDAGADGISLPKVESTEGVAIPIEAARQLADDPPDFRIGLESPRGIFSGVEIAERCRDLPPARAISYGSADYCREIGAPEISDRVKEFLSHLVTGYASIGGLEPFASGTLDIGDLDRQRRLLSRQRELGYVGATCIHPSQIETINEVFTPSEEEYERAVRLVEGFDDYDGDSVVIDGVFLDTATVDRYRDIAARYELARGEGEDDR